MVNTQFSSKIRSIRTDNASDFFKHECQSFLSSLGVIHYSSCPYTPQQNGIVERKHRHILDTARALRFQSFIPIKYWGDCVLTAVYLINRIPTPLLDNKSPYELLFHKPPSLINLRVFGCLCYASVLSKDHKFSPRAIPCVFLGYSSTQKGYKLLNLQTNKTLVSRDVVFHELIFPFADTAQNLNSFTPPFPSVDPSSITDEPVPVIPSHDLLSPVSTSPTVPNQVIPVRRSSRSIVSSIWMHDYACSSTLIKNSTPCTYPIANFLTYNHFSEPHQQFLAALSLVKEPRFYHEAMTDIRWCKAMNDELTALERNNTWDIVKLPPKVKPIGCKWVYKIKLHSDGSVDRFKARLVAKGYTQQPGVDYHDTFSPTAKLLPFDVCLKWL